MFMSHHLNVGQDNDVKVNDESFQNVRSSHVRCDVGGFHGGEDTTSFSGL
jgi:hypothetical protein